jgi:AsmA protein
MPKFSISPQLQNIQIKDLMQLLEPKFKASGLANVTGTVSSAGNEMPAIRSNLNGHLSVSVSNGILYGMDANYWLKSAEATLHKQVAPEKPVNPKTDFGNLTATLTINNGLVSNQDLLIKGPVANVKGQGSIDLGHESLNYHLLLAKTNEATGEAHNDIIPLIITGSFDDPSIKLDMLALTKQIVSKQFDKQKDKLLQKALGSDLAKSPVGQQLGNALGRLLGQ